MIATTLFGLGFVVGVIVGAIATVGIAGALLLRGFTITAEDDRKGP